MELRRATGLLVLSLLLCAEIPGLAMDPGEPPRAAAQEPGGDVSGDPSSPPEAPAEQAIPPQIVEIDTADFAFDPESVTVVRGRPVRFVILARESPHAFSIPDLEFEQVVFPDQPGTFELTFDTTGEVRFRCRFHHLQGMVGTIRVIEPEEEEPRSPPADGDDDPEQPSRRPEDAPPRAGDGEGSPVPGSPREAGS